MIIKRLSPLVLFLFLLSCDKEEELKTCFVQSSVETITGGVQDMVSGQYSSTYTFDNDSRLTQVSRKDIGEGASAGIVSTTIYRYDSEGRIAEAVREGSNYSHTNLETFVYNDLGQVIEKQVTLVENGAESEMSRTEYGYAGIQELESSRHFLYGELYETHEYDYTNGLMTGVRVTPGPAQNNPELKPYQIEISYDNKKTPYAATPALLATKLDFGFPHRHNIVSIKANHDDGTVMSFNTYTVAYTYSPDGYPVSSNQSYPSNDYVERNYDYTYTCE